MNKEDFDLEVKNTAEYQKIYTKKKENDEKRWISKHIDISHVRKLWNIL